MLAEQPLQTNLTSGGTTVEPREGSEATALRAAAKRRVHHFFTNFERLEVTHPGQFPREIVRGEGPYLFDADGHRLLDGCLHLGACPVGHGRAEMADAIANQIRTLEFSSLDEGHSHPWTVELAERLAPLVPVDDPRFYFGSSGSEATETAIKLARVYHLFRGDARRTKILARDGSYHGVGYGGLSANGNPVLREQFAPLVPGFVRAPQPGTAACLHCPPDTECDAGCADALAEIIEREDPSTIAAFIAEPISVHGAVKVPGPRYWPRVQQICESYGILLILDEVFVGFGRTGRMFASEHYALRPDILTIAKGLTSGYVPMGAAVAARHVADVFEGRPFLHNSTYSGHPVACAAALASLEIIEREGLPQHAAELEQHFQAGLEHVVATVSGSGRARAVGMLSSVEFECDGDPNDAVVAITAEAYERGLIIRGAAHPAGGAVFFFPPLVATRSDVAPAFDALAQAMAAVLGARA